LADFLQLTISNPKYYMKSKKSDKGNDYTQMIVKSETTEFNWMIRQ